MSYFDRIKNPVYQGITVALMALGFMILLKLLKISNLTEVDERLHWVISGAMMLFFALMNSVLSLQFTGDMNQYWFQATLSYLGTAVVSSLLAYLFSQMTIDEAGTFKWIYFVLTFGYLLFLSIMRFMRKVVQLAQREDDRWNKRAK